MFILDCCLVTELGSVITVPTEVVRLRVGGGVNCVNS
jgi:hypothetical protein